ncbi:hypothetical protein H0H92_014264, partial [Tricholoma furcatifolium]
MNTPIAGGSPPPAYHAIPQPQAPSLPTLEQDHPVFQRATSPVQSLSDGSLDDELERQEIAVFGRVIASAPPRSHAEEPAAGQANPPPARGRPKKTAAPSTDSVQPDTLNLDILIQVLQPDKVVAGRGRGTMKKEKQEPFKFGPITVTLSVEWDTLLSLVSQELRTTAPCLITKSFEWRFLKPQMEYN